MSAEGAKSAMAVAQQFSLPGAIVFASILLFFRAEPGPAAQADAISELKGQITSLTTTLTTQLTGIQKDLSESGGRINLIEFRVNALTAVDTAINERMEQFRSRLEDLSLKVKP